MSSLTLLHPEETFKIPTLQAMTKCSLFQDNPTLTAVPYRVQSSVSLSIFREFISALEGNAINITDTNFTELHRLCLEFGFSELAAKLSEFRPSINFKEAETRGRIAALQETANQHSHVIAILQNKVTQLSTDFGRLISEVSSLRSVSAGIQTLSEEVSSLKTQLAQKLNDPVVEQLSTEFIELQKEVLTLKAQIATMSLTVTSSPSVRSFDSLIISDFPEIFAEFRAKRFKILWRGSRDGFKAKEFHGRCDGHANTLTVILDTKGNIFGGFTPLEWESPPKPKNKTDESLKSFLFTLKNPHNISARRFALNAEKKHEAMRCDSERGPRFNAIGVADNCNRNTESNIYVGRNYINDTGMDNYTVLTGSKDFQVKEIEVFEITD
jgi:hypothetical protein